MVKVGCPHAANRGRETTGSVRTRVLDPKCCRFRPRLTDFSLLGVSHIGMIRLRSIPDALDVASSYVVGDGRSVSMRRIQANSTEQSSERRKGASERSKS